MSKEIVRPPFKNAYVYFDAFNTDVRVPRLDFIQGEYVKITLKQMTLRYTCPVANVVLSGDILLSPVSSVALAANNGEKAQSLHLFVDKPTSTTAAFAYSFRSNAPDEWGIIVPKSHISGQMVQLTENIVYSVTLPVITNLACVIEITDASY